MIKSRLENNKCGYSTRHSMYVGVVTILSILALFILILPPSYADEGPIVAWESSGGYTLGDGAAGSLPNTFTITDPAKNFNTEKVDNVTATISSIDTAGNIRDSIEITLSEEVSEDNPAFFDDPTTPDPNSGIFRNKNIIFTSGNQEYGLDQTITIVQEDPDDFFGFFHIAPTSWFKVSSSSDPAPPPVPFTPLGPGTFTAGFPITETGSSTQIYTGTIRFSTEASDFDSGTILVQPGDILSVITPKGNLLNGLIVPNPDSRVRALQAAVGDDIVITYDGKACIIDPDDSSLCDTKIGPSAGGGGGGGGGPVVLPSASLVIDTLAGIASTLQSIIAAGGGGLDTTPPSLTRHISSGVLFDPFKPIAPGVTSPNASPQQAPLRINGNDYNLYGFSNTIVTNIIQTGQFTDMSLVFEEASKVAHVAMYFVDQGRDENTDKDPALIFDNGNIVKVDPDGIFGDDIQITTSKEGTKSIFNFGMSFDKPTNKNLVIVSWDDKKNSGTTKVLNAIQVVGNIIPNQVAHFMPIEALGEFDLVKDDNGQYVLSEPVEAQTVTDSPQTIVYPQFIGKMDRHDMKALYDSKDYEKDKANSIMVQKFNLDTKIFADDNDDKPTKDLGQAPQLTWSNVGHKLRDPTKSPDENKELLKQLCWQEHLKAEKTLKSLLVKTKYYED